MLGQLRQYLKYCSFPRSLVCACPRPERAHAAPAAPPPIDSPTHLGGHVPRAPNVRSFVSVPPRSSRLSPFSRAAARRFRMHAGRRLG